MERLLVVAVVAVVAVVVAIVVQRRQPAAPVRTGYNVPAQLHRPDFDRPDAEWLVVVFTSATCSTCAGVWEKAKALDSDAVATQEVEVTRPPRPARPLRHRRGAHDRGGRPRGRRPGELPRPDHGDGPVGGAGGAARPRLMPALSR